MIRLNSQVRGADPTTLEQRSDARDMYSGVGREHRSFRLTTPGYGRYGLHSKLTTYSSIPRKVAERFISGGAILAVACALGYASFKLGQIINKKLGPLAERLTPYYNDIDHRK